MVVLAAPWATTRRRHLVSSFVFAALVAALWEARLSAALSLSAPKSTSLRSPTNQSLLASLLKHTITKPKGLPLFTDVTKHAFPKEWYAWDHVGFPRRYAGTPVFPDFNGDGVLDFFYHNHFEMYPVSDWDMGISRGNNTVSSGQSFWESVGRNLLVCTDADGMNVTKIASDTHGTAILDIDRDGMLDMYIATGGGMGQASGPQKNAMVLWGESNSSVGVDGMSQKFKGGRSMAAQCNLHNPDSRGRFTYFADFNSDGLLDLVFINEVRVDNENMFGYAMMNQGERKFTRHEELSEYANTMILTDADGDGHAAELVVQRGPCLPIDGPDGTTAAAPSWERKRFCDSRPMGSVAVYRFNPTEGKLGLISPPSQTKDKSEDEAFSMQTGDFDGDQVADLIVLYAGHLDFFLSGSRSTGKLPIGDPSLKLKWKPGCDARALRVADFNLDGQEEMLIMCRQPHKHIIYERRNNKWTLHDGDLGDLSNRDLPRVSDMVLKKACHSHTPPAYLSSLCRAQVGQGPQPSTFSYGMSVVDWDNDGFKDVVITHDVGNMILLHNDWASAGDAAGNKFLAVKLVGHESNAYGVGATVLLRANNMGEGQDETVVQLREVYSASHEADWWGGRDDRIIFGLGKAGEPEALTIRWPGKSRRVQVVDNKYMLSNHLNSMQNPLEVHEPMTSR